jgi:hypothetical protein
MISEKEIIKDVDLFICSMEECCIVLADCFVDIDPNYYVELPLLLQNILAVICKSTVI